MTQARRLKIQLGKEQLRVSQWSNQPSFVSGMNKATRALTDQLIDIFDQFQGVSPSIMLDALTPTFEKSQEQVPVDTGELQASGYLEITQFRGNARVEMGYGRGGVPHYAVLVHEMVEIPHRHPGKAKFLSDPIMEDMGDIYNDLKRYYSEFMNE